MFVSLCFILHKDCKTVTSQTESYGILNGMVLVTEKSIAKSYVIIKWCDKN